MTDNKALKKAIRQRMARTGEAYTTARRAVLAHSRKAGSFTLNAASTHAPASQVAVLVKGLAPVDPLSTARFKSLAMADLGPSAGLKGLTDALTMASNLKIKALIDLGAAARIKSLAMADLSSAARFKKLAMADVSSAARFKKLAMADLGSSAGLKGLTDALTMASNLKIKALTDLGATARIKSLAMADLGSSARIKSLTRAEEGSRPI